MQMSVHAYATDDRAAVEVQRRQLTKSDGRGLMCARSSRQRCSSDGRGDWLRAGRSSGLGTAPPIRLTCSVGTCPQPGS
jgi:hypothetical protein